MPLNLKSTLKNIIEVSLDWYVYRINVNKTLHD